MTRRLHTRSERGQMLAIVAVSIVAMCACGAFVMDVGSWFRAQRATQSVSDAAALAGAQELPMDSAAAQALAQEYGDKNGGGISNIQFTTNTFPNDTISVRTDRVAPGFLSRVLGITSVNVGADATARAWNLGSAKYVGPFRVWEGHPMHPGQRSLPVPGRQLRHHDRARHGPSVARRLQDPQHRRLLRRCRPADALASGSSRASTATCGRGWYYSDPGAKFNPQDIADAVAARTGSEILLPVYRSVREQGAGYEYDVIGWIGFHVLAYYEARCERSVDGLLHERHLGRDPQRVLRELLRRHSRQARQRRRQYAKPLAGGMQVSRAGLMLRPGWGSAPGADRDCGKSAGRCLLSSPSRSSRSSRAAPS